MFIDTLLEFKMNVINRKSEFETTRAHISHLRMICGDDDPDLRRNVIEGETGLDALIEQALKIVLEDEAAIQGIRDYQKRVTERRRRLETRAAKLRTLLATVVTELPERKYRHPLALISAFDVDPHVIIQDESAIPTDFWIPQDPKLDESGLRKHLLERQRRLDDIAKCRTEAERRALRDEIDAELAPVSGVTLGNGEISVRIRVA